MNKATALHLIYAGAIIAPIVIYIFQYSLLHGNKYPHRNLWLRAFLPANPKLLMKGVKLRNFNRWEKLGISIVYVYGILMFLLFKAAGY